MREATCTNCCIRYQWPSGDRAKSYSRARCTECGRPLKRTTAVYALSHYEPRFEGIAT